MFNNSNFIRTTLGNTEYTVVFSNTEANVVRSTVKTQQTPVTDEKVVQEPVSNCTGLLPVASQIADVALIHALADVIDEAVEYDITSVNIVVKDSVAIRAFQVRKLLLEGNYTIEQIADTCSGQQWQGANKEEWYEAVKRLAIAMTTFHNVGFTKQSNIYMWNIKEQDIAKNIDDGTKFVFTNGMSSVLDPDGVQHTLTLDSGAYTGEGVITTVNGKKGVARQGKVLNLVKKLQAENAKFLPRIVEADNVKTVISDKAFA